jgi:TNF receptor-associated protein 1
MSRAELIENLGTIAHSGSKAFLKALGEGAAKNSNLIGQFGVGFYSAFMVAKSVKVYAHSWHPGETGHVWTSDGSGSYEIEESDGERRGAKIVIELKDDCGDFAQDWKVKEILERYSAFVSFPINLNGKRINTVQALWLRNKSEIKDEEYTEFYKFQAHAVDEPRLRLHFNADAPLAINALVFVPKENTEKLGFARLEPAVALYCRKVLIDAQAQGPPARVAALPQGRRRQRGPAAEHLARDDAGQGPRRETEQGHHETLSQVPRRGGAQPARRLQRVLRRSSAPFSRRAPRSTSPTRNSSPSCSASSPRSPKRARPPRSPTTSPAWAAEQKEIYYLVGPNRAAIESGPYLEGFKARNLEVLFCYEAVDEYVMNNVREFDGKKLTAADHADVKLSDLPQARGRPERRTNTKDPRRVAQGVARRTRRRGEGQRPPRRFARARAQRRQVHVAPHAPHDEGHEQGRRRHPAARQPRDQPAPPVIKRLFEPTPPTRSKAKLVAEQLLDNALISAGLLDDPTAMVARLNKLLETV